MSVEAASPLGVPSTLSGVEPQLFVHDLAAACEFYVRKMGFKVALVYGEPPFYAQVGRGDHVRLNIRQVDEPVFVGDAREREQLLSASVGLISDAALRQLREEFQAAGVEFQEDLRQQPWGAQTFVVRDPDGNLLLFGASGSWAVERVWDGQASSVASGVQP